MFMLKVSTPAHPQHPPDVYSIIPLNDGSTPLAITRSMVQWHMLPPRLYNEMHCMPRIGAWTNVGEYYCAGGATLGAGPFGIHTESECKARCTGTCDGISWDGGPNYGGIKYCDICADASRDARYVSEGRTLWQRTKGCRLPPPS